MVRAALAGDVAGGERILRDISGVAWSACLKLTRTEAAAAEIFASVLESLQADRFARLRPYDGRSRLTTFVALLVREFLSVRILKLFEARPHQAWEAFEGLFGESIAAIVRRRLPGSRNEDLRRDAYQEVCVGLVANDYRRLKGYGGNGSFGGYVLQTADRLTVDFIRGFSGRLRLPAAVDRLAALEQEVYRRIYWDGEAPDAAALWAALQHANPRPALAEVAAAIEEVERTVGAGHSATARPKQISLSEKPELAEDRTLEGHTQLSPEQEIILNEEQAALRAAIARVPEPEHTYLLIKLRDDLPSRDIARLMGISVQETYKIGQRALVLLKKEFSEGRTEEKRLELSV